MRMLEKEHDGRDIRDILIDALVDHDTDKDAAECLGIDNTTVSAWIARLGLTERVDALRAERG